MLENQSIDIIVEYKSKYDEQIKGLLVQLQLSNGTW